MLPAMRSPAPGRVPGRARAVASAYVLLFALGVAAYGRLWPQAPVLDGDSAQYMESAADLQDGSLDALHFRTPGYPLLLVLTGSAYQPTRALFYASLLLHFASVWLLTVVLHRAGAGPLWRLCLIAVLLLPPYVEPAAYVMTESLAEFVLVCGFASLVLWHVTRRLPWAVLAGVALSLSALVRPVYQLLVPAVAAGVMILHLARLTRTKESPDYNRAAGAMLVAWMVLIGGIASFNQVRFGWVGVAPSAGFHLSTKTMAFVERLPDEYAQVREVLIRERDAQLVKRGGTHTGTQAIWSARPELERLTGLSGPELSHFLVQMNLALIARAPMQYLEEVARSMATYWFPATGRLGGLDITGLRSVWALLHGGLAVLFGAELAVVLGIAMIALTAGRRVRASLMGAIDFTDLQAFVFALAATIVFYTMVLSCFLDIGEPRHRRPTDALFIAATLVAAFVWTRTARTLTASPPAC